MNKVWIAGCSLFVLGAVTSPPARAQARASPVQAVLSDEETETFLREAKIIKSTHVPTGITETRRLTLSDGRITHDASLQVIDVHKASFRGERGTELNFRDSYRYNIAAYRLDRMLNLGMIPVSVKRKVDGTDGALTWWADDVLMMERERYEKRIEPPSPSEWNDQMQQARIFNELIYNTDANLGNLLITTEWQIVLIDFTRAFRVDKKLRSPGEIANARIDARVFEALRTLTVESLTARLEDVLRKPEIRALVSRRDLIVSHFEKELAEKGDTAVICRRPGH